MENADWEAWYSHSGKMAAGSAVVDLYLFVDAGGCQLEQRYNEGAVLMSSYRKALPQFLRANDIVANPQVWVGIATNSDNTSRYMLRQGGAINTLAHATLRDVLAKKLDLNSALEQIDQRVNAILKDAHSK